MDDEQQLPNTCKACAECPYGGPKVGSRGNPRAEIVFIAEAPGVQELKGGVALTGPSGKVFWSTVHKGLKDWGIDPDEDILILNSMQCRPPSSDNATENKHRVQKGVATCRSRLMQELTAYPRKIIVAMGNASLSGVTGQEHSITKVRGALWESPHASIGLIPAVHPAALLRGTGNYRQFLMDISYGLDLARGYPRKEPVEATWVIHETPIAVDLAINSLMDEEYIACDTETGGLRWTPDNEILALGVCARPGVVHIFPEEAMPQLERLFRESRAKFIWHNGKFDMHFVRRFCPSARVDEDTMLLSYALDESGGIHDLEQVAGDLIGAPDYKHMLKPWLPNKKTSYRVVPKPVLNKYLGLDTSNTRQIFDILRRRVREDAKLERLYTRLLIPASETLYWIEERGILLLDSRLEANARRLDKEIAAHLKVVQEIAAKYGMPHINPNSPLQMADLLWDRIKLKPIRRGNRSTAKEVLDRIPVKHPILKAVRAFRTSSKARSTYIDGPIKKRYPDGAIHATYKIHGTRTGRLSSSDINMQNIPRDRRLRGMFTARPGYVFVKVDLNQAELRSLAALSGDQYLIAVYTTSGRSLHKETAAEFYPGWNAKSDEGKEQLMRAKAVNFGIVYGREAPSIAEEFGIPVEESQTFIDKWFDRSPTAKDFIDRCRNAPLKGQTLVTAFGRKKRHWIVTRENLNAMQNEASNFPHQSIASDINLDGAIHLQPILRERGIYIVNLVHDEILMECPDDPETIEWCKSTAIRVLEEIAPRWGITRVPFKAEADVGRRWGIWRKEGVSYARRSKHERPLEQAGLS